MLKEKDIVNIYVYSKKTNKYEYLPYIVEKLIESTDPNWSTFILNPIIKSFKSRVLYLPLKDIKRLMLSKDLKIRIYA